MVHSLDRYKHPVAVRMRTDGRIRCSTVQKHPISGSIKDVFGCGGQIGVHFCHFLFAQVPQRADWRTFSPFFVLQDAPEVARGPLLNEPHLPQKRRKNGRSSAPRAGCKPPPRRPGLALAQHNAKDPHPGKPQCEADCADVGVCPLGVFRDEFFNHHVEHSAGGKGQHKGHYAQD